MRYFVTGATGFVGGELVRQLCELGHEVVALVRSPTAADSLKALGVRCHQGDITNKQSMRGGMEAADGVFHVAAWYKLRGGDSQTAQRVNVEGTRNVLELMRDLKIPRGVYTSTLAVFSDTRGKLVEESYRFTGKHITEYDRTKALAHYDVAIPMIEKGLGLTIVLPGVVYGPGDRSLLQDNILRLLRGKLPFVPRRTAYCWNHIEDTARGHIQAMLRGKPGDSYIIAGPAHTLLESMQYIAQLVNKKPPRAIPPICVHALAAFMKIISSVMRVPDHMQPEALRAAAGVTYLGDNTKACRELGYDPRPLEVGMQQTLAELM